MERARPDGERDGDGEREQQRQRQPAREHAARVDARRATLIGAGAGRGGSRHRHPFQWNDDSPGASHRLAVAAGRILERAYAQAFFAASASFGRKVSIATGIDSGVGLAIVSDAFWSVSAR